MNKTISKNLKKLALGAMLCLSGIALTNCTDNIADENRFTFTGELISDHLENNPDKFSNFCEILKKAKISKKPSVGSMLKTLSSYGSYTCFAPTNEAVDSFMQLMCKERKITSTNLADLPEDVATEIAKNHIIEKGYKVIDVTGAFPKVTMNRRFISLKLEETDNGYDILLDNGILVKESDIETENGYIQVIDEVLNPSSNPLHEQVALHDELRLFAKAINVTGFGTLLNTYEIDPDYDGLQFGPLTIKKEGKAPYPEEKRQRYTVLVETDELLANPDNNHLGIEIRRVEDLYTLAKEFYGNEDPDDYTSPKNALNKYVAYHILDRQLLYSSNGTGAFIMEGYESADGFKSEVNLPTTFDRYDYFETMLPYTLVKVTKPFTNPEYKTAEGHAIVLNYAQEMGTFRVVNNEINMEKYLNVVVLPAEDSNISEFIPSGINGTLHALNKILVYNEKEMTENVLNERMRWDVSSLFPEFTNNQVRWAPNDEYFITYIPANYSTRLEANNSNTNIYYLRPHSTSIGGYPNYQGDELLATGTYDFQYRIPHVPPGDYEIRFGYSQSDMRAVTQFYIGTKGNMQICGIPVNMKKSEETEAIVGWFDEGEGDEKMSEDEILQNDKAMRNREYMKGPASCFLEEGKSMRASNLAIRKILGTYKLGKDDYWLRFKNVTENTSGLDQFNQDYLEIVPTSVIKNQKKPEDQN